MALGIVMLLAGSTGLAPRRVSACSCSGYEGAQSAFDDADVVFSGQPITIESPFERYMTGVELKVDRVYKGTVPGRVWLVAGSYDPKTGEAESSSCDELPQRERYLAFATKRDRHFETWTCSGSGGWRDVAGTVQAPYLFEDLRKNVSTGEPPDRGIPTSYLHADTPTPKLSPTSSTTETDSPRDVGPAADPPKSDAQAGPQNKSFASRNLILGGLAVLLVLLVFGLSRGRAGNDRS